MKINNKRVIVLGIDGTRVEESVLQKLREIPDVDVNKMLTNAVVVKAPSDVIKDLVSEDGLLTVNHISYT